MDDIEWVGWNVLSYLGRIYIWLAQRLWMDSIRPNMNNHAALSAIIQFCD